MFAMFEWYLRGERGLSFIPDPVFAVFEGYVATT